MSGKEDGYWAFFAGDALRTGSKLYSRYAQGMAGDEEMKAVARRVKPGQPLANVLFAAVHFLLLRGAEHPLKRFYASLGGAAKAEDEDPFPLFRDFVVRHRDRIVPMVERRVTNTNEVGRSAILHPGFRAIAVEAGAPFSLVEIGPSAGLNLIWDRYGVRYLRGGAVAVGIGTDADLVLEAELRGERLPPTDATPMVTRRLGLELNPVHLSDQDDRDWLKALVWPEDTARMQRLSKALDLFVGSDVEIRAGDALALLPDALAEIPPDDVACVFHTIAVYQFSAEMKEALESILTVAGLRRTVWRLAFEYDGADYVLSKIRYQDGARDATVLANSHPHGRWLEWRGMS